MNIFDFETNPTYLPSSTTGRFHAPVSSKVFITLSIESVTCSMAGGMDMNLLTCMRLYRSGRNMMLRISSSITTPWRCPSALSTGNRLRFDCEMVSTIPLRSIPGLTGRKSVSMTLSIFSRVRTALSLWWVRSSPRWARRMV